MNSTEIKRRKGMRAVDEGIPMVGKVIIALLLVGAMFLLWNVLSGTFTKAQNNVGQMNNKLDMQDTMQYDGTIVTGQTVISYLDNHLNSTFKITVKIGSGTPVTKDPSTDGKAVKPSGGANSLYKYGINPALNFYCKVNTDNNGQIIESVEFNTTKPDTTKQTNP